MTESLTPAWTARVGGVLLALAGSWFGKVVFGFAALILAFVGADRFGVPTRHVGGIVKDEKNTWSMKRRHRCRVYVTTPAGDVNDRYTGPCRGEWKRGEAVTLEIVYGRLTGKAVVGGSMRHAARP